MLFAVVFVIGKCSRVVEFEGEAVTKKKKKFLSLLEVKPKIATER